MPGEGGTTTIQLALSALNSLLGFLRAERLPRDIQQRGRHDRRRGKQRRAAPIIQRLRIGLWLQYHKVTRSGEFDDLVLDTYYMQKTKDALWPHAKEYEYVDRGTNQAVSAQHAFYSAVEFVWANPGKLEGATKARKSEPFQCPAVFVIEAIAEQLHSTNQLREADQRIQERREQSLQTESHGQQLITPALVLGCVACTAAAASPTISREIGKVLEWLGLGVAGRMGASALRAAFGAAAGLLALWLSIHKRK